MWVVRIRGTREKRGKYDERYSIVSSVARMRGTSYMYGY